MLEFLEWAWPYVLAVIDLIVVVIASSHVVLTKRDNRAALGWIAVIWFAPILGSLLYAGFGVNRIRRKARRLRKKQSKQQRRQLEQAAVEELTHALADDALHLTTLNDFIFRMTREPLLPGNRLTPLDCGDEAYVRMLAAIDSAEKSVALCTYIFDNDAAGREFAEALARALDALSDTG